MIALAGPLSVGALLLVAGGTVKVVRPHTTANAVHVAPVLVRAGAAAEVVIGLAALASGARWPAALVATSYLGFAAFVGWARFRGTPLATCACFGEDDTPPTVVHVVIDLVIALTAAGAAATGDGRSAVALGPAVMVEAAVVAYLTFLACTSLPRLQATTG